MPAGKPKPPTKTAEQKKRQAEVLARMQRDIDGFVDKYQEILDRRAAQYAGSVESTWRRIGANLSRAITDLYNQYADANGQLDGTRLHEMERLRFLRTHITNMMYALRGDQDQLTNSLAYTYVDSAVWHAWALEKATKLAIVTPALTHGHVMGILANPWLADGATYSDRLRANTAYLAAKMKDSVTEAVGMGWDVFKAARRIKEVAGEGYHNSVRLARTEINRVASQASSHVFMQNADILDGKRWRATLDARTAPKDAANDGRVYDLSYDTPEHAGRAGERIPNHPNCRCKYSPVVSGVSDKVRERIARGAGDSKSRFGERIYTTAPDYRAYAKERGLPDLDEALAKENPKKYLRRGEDMSAYSIPGGQLTKAAATAAAAAALAGGKPNPQPAGTPPADTLAIGVQERVAKGIASEADLRDIGKLVADEVNKALPADVQEMGKTMREARAEYKRLAKEINDTFKKHGHGEQYSKIYADNYPAYEKARQTYLDLMGELQGKRAPVLRDTLARIRPMGGAKLKWEPGGNTSVESVIDYTTDYLPADWLAKSNAAGTMLSSHTDRGFYQEAGSWNNNQAKIVLSGKDDADLRRVAFHEMGHRFENTVPGISGYEEEFYLRRTKGQNLKWMGAGYKKAEVSRKDKFLELYMGKDYSPGGDGKSQFYELLSMGIEGLYSGNYDLDADTDYRDFILGMMAAL